MAGRALVAAVSAAEPYTLGRGTPIAVLDYGCKRSILARLERAGVEATVWPHSAEADAILRTRPAGVLLSNGPGDPAALPAEVAVVRDLLGRIPILGICLGHQLLALAAGYETFKLPFGHRGANHPVLELVSSRVIVTSQNPGGARSLAPVPSRGGPRPARRLARDRSLGRGAPVCRGGLISTRSA
jgi:carbamoyl-phosphate synthase small subunit